MLIFECILIIFGSCSVFFREEWRQYLSVSNTEFIRWSPVTVPDLQPWPRHPLLRVVSPLPPLTLHHDPPPSWFISRLWWCPRSCWSRRGLALITHAHTYTHITDRHHTHTGKSMQINPQAEPCYSINVSAPVISALVRIVSDDLETTSPL